ncbi:SpaA isopeptide-forming pilin-related protein [Bacillus siamensis]|uniref:SpaA isopeptide-forming pilin-related protein n=1 Tax=Bacillus siamensis TaxID=659243 RepID=UPI002E1FA77F|nr:SpaA isopeptide-forming pilin-related protein [Bacillus siamensis]MED5098492.1 SpaA isopeptide-forming pilin-related protein [Bacillus siamensis]
MSIKKLSVLLSIFLIALSSIFSFAGNKAFADSFAGDPNTKVTGWAFDESIGGYLPTEQIKSVSDPTRFAYCLEPGKHSPDHVDMPSAGQMNDKVYRVLSYGYPNATASELGVSSNAKAHYATQIAIWLTIGEVKASDLTYSDNSIEKAVQHLLNKAAIEKDTQNVSVTVTPDNAKASVKGDYLVTEPYTVKSSATGTYTVSLSGAPKKAVVTDVNGKVKSTFAANEQFKIQLPKNTPTDKVKVTVNTEMNKLVSMQYNSDGTYQNIVSLKEVKKNVEVGVSASWETTGALQILKVTEDNAPLTGVIFDIFNQSGEKVTSVQTDKNGKATASKLPIGNYTAVETKTAEGFILDQEPQTVTVNADETTTLSIINKKIRGNVELKKIDTDSKNSLEGAVFELLNSKGKAIGQYTTDKEGKILIKNLEYGSYSFVEKSAPNGYVLNTEPINFDVKENKKTVQIQADNKMITGSLEITKTDVADGNTRLKGAEFTIFNENGEEVAKGKTDKDGIARFDNLPFGKYSYKETFAPRGYLINEETFSFEIKENGQIIKHML